MKNGQTPISTQILFGVLLNLHAIAGGILLAVGTSDNEKRATIVASVRILAILGGGLTGLAFSYYIRGN